MAERNCLIVLDSGLDKFYLVLQVSLFGFVRVVLCLRCFSILGYRPEFVTHYGLLSPRLVSVLGLYRCFQSDSLLYLVFSLYSYWPFVFHPSIDIMPCAFRLAYIRLNFDWKAEEMEGKRAVSLLEYDHPSTSPVGLVYVLFICHSAFVIIPLSVGSSRLSLQIFPFLNFLKFYVVCRFTYRSACLFTFYFWAVLLPQIFKCNCMKRHIGLVCFNSGQYVEFKTFCTPF